MYRRLLLAALLVFGLAPVVSADFIRGDANSDGSVNLIDVFEGLNYLYLPGRDEPTCLDGADVDDSGVISLFDSILLINHLFVSGSPPPDAPYPLAGDDPTPDAFMSCPATGILDYETLDQRGSSGALEQTRAIRDVEEWKNFWNVHTGSSLPQPALPEVNFQDEMVVVVVRHFPTGGYFVVIDEIVATGDEIEVHFTLGAPVSQCPVTFATTQPVHVVKTARALGEVTGLVTVVDTCP